jgi:hypothetical protein
MSYPTTIGATLAQHRSDVIVTESASRLDVDLAKTGLQGSVAIKDFSGEASFLGSGVFGSPLMRRIGFRKALDRVQEVLSDSFGDIGSG